MDIMPELLTDVLKGAILISGLITIMMMMIECLNIESKGRFFAGIRSSRIGGVLVGALLGIIPGCMGGFAAVSLYTHRLISFGGLVAMMIATCGDESFLMLATIPSLAVKIFVLLFALAIVAGILTDIIVRKDDKMHCTQKYEFHHEDEQPHKEGKHAGWKRILMAAGVALFIAALATGLLGEDEGTETAGLNLLSEDWMNLVFSALSLVVLGVVIFGSDHFVEGHLWHHVIAKHLPVTFAWTFGILAVIGIGLNYFDIALWISSNTALMILLATAIGLIPQSGPHMIFITMFAAGIVPVPVLLASCVSQNGHACLPLIAESKKSFIKAKALNSAIALAVGYASMLLV